MRKNTPLEDVAEIGGTILGVVAGAIITPFAMYAASFVDPTDTSRILLDIYTQGNVMESLELSFILGSVPGALGGYSLASLQNRGAKLLEMRTQIEDRLRLGNQRAKEELTDLRWKAIGDEVGEDYSQKELDGRDPLLLVGYLDPLSVSEHRAFFSE
jgi:hypothetical protein